MESKAPSSKIRLFATSPLPFFLHLLRDFSSHPSLFLLFIGYDVFKRARAHISAVLVPLPPFFLLVSYLSQFSAFSSLQFILVDDRTMS